MNAMTNTDRAADLAALEARADAACIAEDHAFAAYVAALDSGSEAIAEGKALDDARRAFSAAVLAVREAKATA